MSRPVTPERCHIVTPLTDRSRSGVEPAKQRLCPGKLGDDVRRGPFAGDQTDGLSGPHDGVLRTHAGRTELVLATVPGRGEGVADRAAAVLRRPRDAAAYVEH